MWGSYGWSHTHYCCVHVGPDWVIHMVAVNVQDDLGQVWITEDQDHSAHLLPPQEWLILDQHLHSNCVWSGMVAPLVAHCWYLQGQGLTWSMYSLHMYTFPAAVQGPPTLFQKQNRVLPSAVQPFTEVFVFYPWIQSFLSIAVGLPATFIGWADMTSLSFSRLQHCQISIVSYACAAQFTGADRQVGNFKKEKYS